MQNSYYLTEQQVRSWRDDGVVVLRGVIDDDWLEALRDGVEKCMKDPSAAARDFAEDGKGRFFTDHHMFRRLDAFRRFLYNSPIAAIAAGLMGARKTNLIDEHLLVKEPGTENPTYWHHDLPYYEVAGHDFCSIWTPLDPVTEATGAMKFVKGSHLWGKLFHPVRIAQGALVDEAEALDGPAPDIDAEPAKYNIELFEMDPGDCVAFHGATLHSATPNSSSDRRRRALSLRFAGDDITWNPRPFRSSGPGRPNLKAGDPIDSDQYPRIWTG
jgi:ectoine hydroxylase-related dioxygenase (phytanoyl-CoA dioxygenase family)